MFKKKNNKQQLIQNPTVLYWRIKLLTNIKKNGCVTPIPPAKSPHWKGHGYLTHSASP